ncbi:hypothetical protein FRB90_004905 [Tulasnella sp. 427]|nr:hypothetical protein FRB90_004905 [Tulasnella sp. 427]
MSFEGSVKKAVDVLFAELKLDHGNILEDYRVPGDSQLDEAEQAIALYGPLASSQLASLRRRRNILKSSIYRLPLEALSQIFIFYVQALREEDEATDCLVTITHRRGQDSSLSPKILTLAHVSRRWYEVATCTSRLWDRIDVHDHFDCIKFMLRNSSTALLSVVLGLREKDSKTHRKAGFKEATAHAWRWKSADLYATNGELTMLSNLDFPSLQHLQIAPNPTQDTGEPTPGPEQDDLPIPLPRSIFQGKYPELETLHLTYWTGWEDIEFPKLRHLKICHEMQQGTLVGQLLTLLSRCPILEVFYSKSHADGVDDKQLVTLPMVELPHLRRIVLERCSPRAATQIFQHLELHPLDIVGAAPTWSPVEPPGLRFLPALEQAFQMMVERAKSVHLVFRRGQTVFTCDPSTPSARTFSVDGVPWRTLVEWAMEVAPRLAGLVKTMVFGPDGSSHRGNGFGPLQMSGALLRFDGLTSIAIEKDAETDQILRYYFQLDSETDARSNHWPSLKFILLVGCHSNSVFPTKRDDPDGTGTRTPRDGLDWIRSDGRVQVVNQHSKECEGCELLKKKLELDGECEEWERNEDQRIMHTLRRVLEDMCPV